MSELKDYRKKPLPEEHHRPDDVSFRFYPVDLTRPESNEPLVTASECRLAAESFYARTDGMNAPYFQPLRGALLHVWFRNGVAERLVRVDLRLKQDGLELFLLDGFRREECQTDIYLKFYDIVKKAHPDTSEDDLEEIIRNYISKPNKIDYSDSATWFSHSTGAAIDLSIRRRATGEFLYMGSIFDDPSELSHTRYYETRPDDSASVVEARENRRMLFWLMYEEGFANLPAEWWHFDYGDQLWSKNRRIWEPELEPVTAWYGACHSPE